MSLQTSVFENGRWITRSIDPYHIRAQNMDTGHKTKDPLSRPSPAKPPSPGLLTKTLVRSSVIKWIIPARVRHQSKNDVLIITADYIAIKEALGNYTLKDISIKADFDSRIKSARIIGDPRELTRHDVYGYAQKSREDWEYHEANVDLEHPDTNKCTLPPHIAVLALESQKLVFLCAANGIQEEMTWLSSHKELPTASSPLKKLGEHIAVDPKSRVIAIAAHEGRVYLYALKSMKRMREEFESNATFEPIQEELCLPDFPDGATILKMEFLHPPLNDHGQIILLLIVSKQDRTIMMWYEWSSGSTLRESQLKLGSIGLPSDEQLPLLLIPLKLHFAAFIIIYEKRITLYRDILTGSPVRYIQHLKEAKDPEEPGSSDRQPIWVQWARPMRTPKHSRGIQFDDAIYLCREDGIVQYLELYNTLGHMLDSTHPAGRLRINVNTAFAILDVGPGTDDMLAAGGNMSEGGLWYFGARVDPTRVSTIPNWTPMSDFITVSDIDKLDISIPSNSGRQKVIGAPSRMFACTGRGKHGAISELRYGFKASKKSVMVVLDDEVDHGVLGMWAFHGYYGETEQQNEKSQQSKDATYVLISYPAQTSLLRIQTVQHKAIQYNGVPAGPLLPDIRTFLVRETQLVTEDLGFDYDARTITSAVTPYGIAIQVTGNSIRAARLPVLPQSIKVEKTEDDAPERIGSTAFEPQARYVYQFDEPHRVLGASIHNFHNVSKKEPLFDDTYVLLALQKIEGFDLHLGRFSDHYQLIAAISSPTQPVCLLLQSVHNSLLAIVTTVCGRLLFYEVDRARGILNSICDFKFDGLFAICDSVVLISSDRNDMMQAECLVVCGLRNGLVMVFRLTRSATWELVLHEKLAIGHTSVNITGDSNARSRAVINCENVFSILEYTRGLEAPATVSKIWISDYDQPLLQIGPLSAVAQAVSSWVPGHNSGFLAGALLCMDGNKLHTVSLELKSLQEMVPRRIPIDGSPVKIIHSTYLNKLIILCNKMTVSRERLHNTPGKRSLSPSIVFVDPDKESDIKADPDAMETSEGDFAIENESLMRAERKPGENFLGITEWLPRVGQRKYHMLIVNSTLTKADKPIGRLLFFAITPGDSNTPKLKLKKKTELEAPVYSVVTYGETSLIYSCGSELCMLTLALAESPGYKWQPPIRADMRSPGRCLTVVEPFIYVSSTQESLAVFKYERDSLTYQYGDQSARDGLHHVYIAEHSLVLASDMNNRVVGLWEPPERRIDNTMPTVFEAILPFSITRFRHVNRPLWHRDSAVGDMTSNALIGSSTDGVITQFTILDKGWRLLRFIQNMAERNPFICPYTKPPRQRHIEPSTTKPTDMHVDGDILQRVVDRGGEQLLREMLDAEPALGSDTDFESAGARWNRFKELAEEITADTDFKEKVEEAGTVWEEAWAGQWVTLTMMWIRYQLRSAL